MTTIKAFNGLRYSEKAGDLSQLISPPYDVINNEQRESLYRNSIFNISRVTKSKDAEIESEELKYKNASELFKSWITEEILKEDKPEKLYGYEQEFIWLGKKIKRNGVICLLKTEKFGKDILGHEKTLVGPKKDRLQLLKKTNVQLEPIFGIIIDKKNNFSTLINQSLNGTSISHCQETDQTHKLYEIQNYSEIINLIENSQILIADGHHRFETTLNYYTETQNEKYRYILINLVSSQDPGLIVQPTHRLVKNIKNYNENKFIDDLQNHFDMKTFDHHITNEIKNILMSQKQKCPIFICTKSHSILLTPKDTLLTQRLGALAKHDASLLHEEIFENILGLSQESQAEQQNIEYLKDLGSVIKTSKQRVLNGEFQMVCYLNPPPMDLIVASSLEGTPMPQKSTFFYPKVPTGLVFYNCNR